MIWAPVENAVSTILLNSSVKFSSLIISFPSITDPQSSNIFSNSPSSSGKTTFSSCAYTRRRIKSSEEDIFNPYGKLFFSMDDNLPFEEQLSSIATILWASARIRLNAARFFLYKSAISSMIAVLCIAGRLG